MFKKLLKGLVIGGAALTIAATPSIAKTVEINIFGASAQYKFWTAAAPHFLNTICAEADIYAAKDGSSHDRDTGVAVCAGTEGLAGITGNGYDGTANGGTANDTLIIRYTTNASYDGIRAVQDNDTDDADNCPTDGDRYQAEPTGTELKNFFTEGAGTTIASIECMDVTVGASDVAASTFMQSSDGFAEGPATTDYTDVIDRDINNLTIPPSYQVDRPIVVPFGFYANSALPLNNLSRMEAVNIFAGKVTNWQDLDPTYPDQQVVVCHRHAGSGTAATLNAAVFRGDDVMPTVQQDGDFLSPYYNMFVEFEGLPAIYFNKGSSEAVECAGYTPGGVAYADSDKCVNGCSGSRGDLKAIAYQGVGGDANTDVMSEAVKNGRAIFWSAQYLYSNPTGETKRVIDSIVGFASVEANLATTGKGDFWAAQDAMNWEKATDFAWPSPK